LFFLQSGTNVIIEIKLAKKNLTRHLYNIFSWTVQSYPETMIKPSLAHSFTHLLSKTFLLHQMSAEGSGDGSAFTPLSVG
jgi:hypothetical protein